MFLHFLGWDIKKGMKLALLPSVACYPNLNQDYIRKDNTIAS